MATHVAGDVALVLLIDGEPYQVGTSPVADRFVILTKQENLSVKYLLGRADKGRLTCTCPHYKYQLAGTPARCKHGQAVTRLGLL